MSFLRLLATTVVQKAQNENIFIFNFENLSLIFSQRSAPWTLLFNFQWSGPWMLDGQRPKRKTTYKYIWQTYPPSPIFQRFLEKSTSQDGGPWSAFAQRSSRSISRGNGRTRLCRDFRTRRRHVKGTPGNKWVYRRSSTFRPFATKMVMLETRMLMRIGENSKQIRDAQTGRTWSWGQFLWVWINAIIIDWIMRVLCLERWPPEYNLVSGHSAPDNLQNLKTNDPFDWLAHVSDSCLTNFSMQRNHAYF